jgi:hypothetical protein
MSDKMANVDQPCLAEVPKIRGPILFSKRYQILRVLPVVTLACSLLPGPAQRQFTQQGPKLAGTGAIGNAAQGVSVAPSADGNTTIVGRVGDDNFAGAAWVYTRSALPGRLEQGEGATLARDRPRRIQPR